MITQEQTQKLNKQELIELLQSKRSELNSAVNGKFWDFLVIEIQKEIYLIEKEIETKKLQQGETK
jgi:predicted XRE-type DNA-binding protein